MGSLLLKHDAPRKARLFFACWLFSIDLSSTNSRLMFALSKVSTFDWNKMKSVLYVLHTTLLIINLTQIEFLYELYYI